MYKRRIYTLYIYNTNPTRSQTKNAIAMLRNRDMYIHTKYVPFSSSSYHTISTTSITSN